MRTAIILAGALIGNPSNLTTWLIFGIGLAVCVSCDLMQTEWLRDKNKTGKND